jgi:hypothetical protein
LRKLRETTKRPAHDDPEEALFFLSAFLSAGRSVTFVLRKEVPANYLGWFEDWRAAQSNDDRELLAYMNEQRVREVHRTGAATLGPELKWVPAAELHPRHVHPSYGIQLSLLPGTEPPKFGLPFRVFTEDGVGRKAVEACDA